MSLLNAIQSTRGETTQSSGTLLNSIKATRGEQVTPQPTFQTPTPTQTTQPKTSILSMVGSLIKGTAQKAFSIVKTEFEKEKATAKIAMDEYRKTGDYNKLLNISSTPIVENAKQTLSRQLQELETIPEKNKLQEYRIKNIKERIEELDKYSNLSTEEQLKKKGLVQRLTIERLGGQAGAGIVSTGKSLLDAVTWLAPEKISDKAKLASDRVQVWSNFVRQENQTLADEIAQGAGSTVPFWIIGAWTGTLAQGLAKVSPKVASWFAGSASGAIEAMTEAGMVYRENIDQGKSKKEADNAAFRTFAANIVLNILTDKFGMFDNAEGTKKILASGSLEGLQEATQQVISNTNTGRPYDEGVLESGVIGAIIGGGIGSLTGRKIEQITTQEEKPTVKPIVSVSKQEPDITNKLNKTDYETILKPKIESVGKVKDGEVVVIQTGKSEWVDTQVDEALNRGVNKNTKVMIVKESDLKLTGDKEKDLRGERILTSAKPVTQAQEVTTKPSREVVTPKVELTEEPKVEKTPSKIAQSIQRKAIEQNLTKGFKDLAGYDKITIKEQSQKASDLLQDIEKTRRVIKGDEALPTGLRGTALITAVEEYIKKTGDKQLAYELANSPLVSETSTAAQELRLAAEREPDSLAQKLTDLRKAKEQAVKKRTGKKANEAVKEEVTKIKKQVKKVDKYDWDTFVKSIEC